MNLGVNLSGEYLTIHLRREQESLSWNELRVLSSSILKSVLTRMKPSTIRTTILCYAWESLTQEDMRWFWVAVHLPTLTWSMDCGDSSVVTSSLVTTVSSTLPDSGQSSAPSTSGSIPCSPPTSSMNGQANTDSKSLPSKN